MTRPEEATLLERQGELERIDALIEGARGGEGAFVLIEAPGGMGKTALLAATSRRAVAAGMTAAEARGSDLETQFPFGIVRQLFEPWVRTREQRTTVFVGAAALAALALGSPSTTGLEGDASAASAFAVLYALYWLVANVCDRGPIALLIDDLDLADASSLRFLAFLRRRLDELPLLLACTLRPPEPGTGNPALAEVVSGLGGVLLRPRPLSSAAVGVLVEDRLGQSAAPEFVAACHRATAGNPFYLTELLRDIDERRIEPTAAEAQRVPALGPRTVSRALLFRVGALPGDALSLVRACAVLGDGVRLVDAAKLAELESPAAAAAADALVRASILVRAPQLTFIHPIARAAVYAELGPHERADLHSRAAQILARGGASSQQLAGHLVLAEPDGDARTVEAMRDAARKAMAAGAPDEAARFLRRALEEPPGPHIRSDVLFELGIAEASLGAKASVEHVGASVETTSDPRLRGIRALALGGILQMAARIPEAVQALGEAVGPLPEGDADLAAELEIMRYWSGRLDLATYPQVAGQLERLRSLAEGPDGPQRRELLVYLGLEAICSRSAAEGCELIDRALAPPGLLAYHAGDSVAVSTTLTTLIYVDRLEAFDALLEGALTDVRLRGSLLGFSTLSTFRSMAQLRRGQLDEAETDAQAALDAASLGGWGFGSPGLLSFLVDVLLERGEVDAAALALQASGMERDVPSHVVANFLLDSRGRLRVTQGQVRRGLEDILLCGDRQEALRIHCPGIIPWRSNAALAHLSLGERDAAQSLAGQELELARRLAGPRAVGIASRVLGLAVGGDEGLELLRAALAGLETSPARLEHARALVDLGAALRRRGQRAEARELLMRGLELATTCGATALVGRGREELIATGARPRRVMRHGIDALTASERRVGRMAAEGLSNPEIAQALFITRKTVEKHLANAYSKVGVDSRSALAEALSKMPPT
jgi:DNA-binding NarL/FixJ family response regulator